MGFSPWPPPPSLVKGIYDLHTAKPNILSHFYLPWHRNNLWHSWPWFLSKTLFSRFPSLRGSSISLVSSVGASSLTRPLLLKILRAPPKICSSVIYPMASVTTFRLRVPNASLYCRSLLNSRFHPTAYVTPLLEKLPGISDSLFT